MQWSHNIFAQFRSNLRCSSLVLHWICLRILFQRTTFRVFCERCKVLLKVFCLLASCRRKNERVRVFRQIKTFLTGSGRKRTQKKTNSTLRVPKKSMVSVWTYGYSLLFSFSLSRTTINQLIEDPFRSKTSKNERSNNCKCRRKLRNTNALTHTRQHPHTSTQVYSKTFANYYHFSIT